MRKAVNLTLVMIAAAVASTGLALGAERSDTQGQRQVRERIYGSEVMTHGERERYRQRLGAARNDVERKTLRNDHRERMRERARARGVTLP